MNISLKPLFNEIHGSVRIRVYTAEGVIVTTLSSPKMEDEALLTTFDKDGSDSKEAIKQVELFLRNRLTERKVGSLTIVERVVESIPLGGNDAENNI